MKPMRLAGALVCVSLLLAGCATSASDDGTGVITESPRPTVSPTPTISPTPTEYPTPNPEETVILDPTQDPLDAGVEVAFGGPPYGEGSEGPTVDGVRCTSLAFDPKYPEDVTFTIERVLTNSAEVDVAGSECGYHGASCIGYVIDPAMGATDCSVELVIPPSVVEVFVESVEGVLWCPTQAMCDEVTTSEDQGEWDG